MNNKTKIFGGLLAAAVIAGFGISTVEAGEPHHGREKKENRWERIVLELLAPGHHRYEHFRPAPPPPPPAHHRPAPPPPPRGHR